MTSAQRELSFYGLHSPGWFLFCFGAVLAALVLIALLLRYERRLVPRRVGNALLVLRITVLVVLLVALAEPTLTWSLEQEEKRRIVVALDVSESMNTRDAHATRAEKLRWARALGLIGNPAIDARLDRWIKSYEEGNEPEFVDDSEAADPQRRSQLAEARRENLERLFEEIDRLPRKDIARRVLTGTASPLLEKLREIGEVDLLLFAGETQAAGAEVLDTLAAEPPRALRTDASDLGRGLTPPQNSSAAALAGIVLLTDGRDTEGRDVLGAAARLGRTGAKVCPIVFGSRSQPKDLAIGLLEYPSKVFQDDSAVLKATLNTSGFSGQELTVMLEKEDGEPVVRTITPTGVSTQMQFDLDASTTGRQAYTLRTEPQEGEIRTDNNSKQFVMHVVDDQTHVLLLEGEARWEFRFIDNALSRDDRVELEKVVFDQPYLGVLPEPFFPRELPAIDDEKESPFDGADLVIVGDLPPHQLPEALLSHLERFVSESAGTVVFVAGKRYLPLAFRSPILDRMLPMTNLRPVDVRGPAATSSPVERGFRLKLTPDGEQRDMLQFDADAALNRDIWAGLPGHSWGLLGEAKPGASVLAYAAESEDFVTLDEERRNSVIVQQPYGFGQVLWIGIDSTWRWRHRVGDLYHHRFWGQVARWAADNKAAAGNEFVRFDLDRSEIEVGEDALVRARWSRSFLNRHPQLKARAEFYRADDRARVRPFTTLDLLPAESRPLLHEARAASLPEGAWHVRLVAEGADLGPDEIAASLYVHPKHTPELNDLSAHRQLLGQIAQASGGRLFDPDQIAELPAQFQTATEHATVRREEVLWDRWYTMVAFFALLTAEWLVRKLNGLP